MKATKMERKKSTKETITNKQTKNNKIIPLPS